MELWKLWVQHSSCTSTSSKIPLNNISIKKLLQEEDFAIVPFELNSSMPFGSSSRYVESRLVDNRLQETRRDSVFVRSLLCEQWCFAYLVRFGGAGAVLPRLLVVRRIWTLACFPPVENVLSFDVVEPVSASSKY